MKVVMSGNVKSGSQQLGLARPSVPPEDEKFL
jgi:hypothetical protein